MKKFLCLLILTATLAGAAQYDLRYLQENAGGKLVERVVTLTPSTFLAIDGSGQINVQSASAFRSAIGLVPGTDVPTLGGNNTFTGTNTFNGTTSLGGSLVVAEDGMVTFGETGTGFRYNPELTGQLELVFPGGVAAFYQTGAPLRPFFYFPGTIQADYLVGAIDGVTINADGLEGTIPSNVFWNSMPEPNSYFIDDANYAGVNGIPYVDGGINIGMEPTPVGARYYMSGYVEDGGDSKNLIAGQYRSAVQVSADTHPSASASLDFPSIAAAGVQSLTITVSGADTTNTPSVHLGWSAALPAGVVVAQAYVSATNTVTITLANLTAAPIDPTAVTCRASITQY